MFYIRQALEHYRRYKVYLPSMHNEHINDTVDFFPAYMQMSKKLSQDMVVHAAKQLSYALQNPQPATPYRNIGDMQIQAL
eukprot:6380463-Ditylum_brightwellii.AAC.1